MIKRYDIQKDEMIELTQEDFDKIENQLRAVTLHYKRNSPENFDKFRNEYFKGN